MLSQQKKITYISIHRKSLMKSTKQIRHIFIHKKKRGTNSFREKLNQSLKNKKNLIRYKKFIGNDICKTSVSPDVVVHSFCCSPTPSHPLIFFISTLLSHLAATSTARTMRRHFLPCASPSSLLFSLPPRRCDPHALHGAGVEHDGGSFQ